MIAVYIFLGLMVLSTAAAFLYLWLGWFKRFYHDLLGWHRPDESLDESFDGCSVCSVCKYCGKEIMQDSQGNWF